MKIIDFHVHPFRRKEYHLGMFPETYQTDQETMIRQLTDSGITHICGSVLSKEYKYEGWESLRRLNEEALALREELGGFYTPGFHIHPAYVRESCDEIEKMYQKGLRMIGELVPYMHGWGEFEEKNWMEIMDTAGQYGMVCSYHTPFEYDMSRMLKSHPNLIFVAAHPGDRVRVFEQEEMLKQYKNLYLDLSGGGLFRFGMLKYLTKRVGSDRILFGTDYPICNPRMYVQAVFGEEISDADREAIFYRNAQRILNVSEE